MNKNTIVLEGRLMPVMRNAGSKSEHWGFALVTPDLKQTIVEMEADHETLAPLNNRWVRIQGMYWGGRCIGDTIYDAAIVHPFDGESHDAEAVREYDHDNDLENLAHATDADMPQARVDMMFIIWSIVDHANQRGDDRCWIDDAALWKLLPEARERATQTPFPNLDVCERYCKAYSGNTRPMPNQQPRTDFLPPVPFPQHIVSTWRMWDGINIGKEILRMRRAIRKLLSQPLVERTHALYTHFYGTLPKNVLPYVDCRLPSEKEFLPNCHRFCSSRPVGMMLDHAKCHEW